MKSDPASPPLVVDFPRFIESSQVARSIIVCLAQVSELHRDEDGGGTAVLRSGVRLRVARSRWEELERALAIGRGLAVRRDAAAVEDHRTR